MKDAIDLIIDPLLQREGGDTFTDRASDNGGPTRWGVTMPALAQYRGHPVTVNDIRNLTEAEARALYRRDYVERPGFMKIKDELLRELLVDIQVNHRPGVAVKFLQRSLGATMDGILGPITLGLLEHANPNAIALEVAIQRALLYFRIIHDDPKQAANANGWGNRVAGFMRRIPVAGPT